MTALLTDNLPLLAGAPNGIKKLRELILELAVRGKLVPQDPNDEPANELLKRIAEEKARLVAEGKIKKQKPLAGIEEEEKPFELPSGWVWRRFGEVFSLEYGDNLPADKRSNTGEYPVYGSNGVVGTHSNCFVDSPCIVVGRKGSAGALNLCLSTGCCVTDVAYYCIPPSAFSLDYAFKLFHTLGLDSLGKGIKPGLNRNEAYELVVAVPPLAEQHRIVAKVDELMALCDRLEARQADAGSAHTQLVQALLDSLTLATDAADFAASWQRLAEHFHTLFATESSIDALKQTLLQLAVMGKLVPQDPRDEPASELLKNIQSEKQAAIVGKNKLDKLRYSDMGAESPFKLPSTWAWARLGELAISGPSNGNSPKPASVETPYRCLTLSATTRGTFNDQCFKFVDIDADTASKYFLKDGDLLVQRANSIDYVGVSAIYDGPDDQFIFPDLMMRLRISTYLSQSFVHAYLSSITGRAYFRNHASGTQGNMPKINQGTVVNAPIPIPPLPEQHRIVAKVDQLMTLCDQLKARLTQVRQLNEQLASTLVERALADDGLPAPVTTDQKAARTLLAAEITHQLHGQRTFGQRKLQKVIYLAEHAARLATIQGSYLRNVAGPHDRQLMSQVEGELQKLKWYERTERETVGHAYRPLPQAGQHRQAYNSAWSTAERATIERVVDLMRDWDTDRCEMTVTLYAAWNDFIIEGRPVTDDAIVNEVLHRWNDAKLRFSKNDWLAVLTEMKKNSLLTPSGFGRRTIGGTPTLPGFEYSSTTS